MPGPQTEDGYTRIANELYDAIIRVPFSKRELLIVLAVIRKTYGYNKKVDALSVYQIAAITGIDRANVSRTVSNLIQKNVISESGTGRFSHGTHVKSIGINKDYGHWKTDAKTTPVPKQHQCQNGTKTDAKLAQRPMPKRHTQKTIPKDNKDKGGVVLPDWISPEQWAEFKSFRKEIKKPLGAVGESRAIKRLEKLREYGNDVGAVIDQTIERGWSGFFPLKEDDRPVSSYGEGGI